MLLSPAKALISRHRCLPHPTADFILKSPLSKLSHHLSLHRRTAGSAFLLALAAFIVTLLSSLRRRLIHHRATAPFIIASPVLPLCRAATAFFVTPPFPSLLRRRFCLRHCAAASSAFVVAPPLPSLSRRCCCRHRAAARFIVAPPLYFLTSSHLAPPPVLNFSLRPRCLPCRHRPCHRRRIPSPVAPLPSLSSSLLLLHCRHLRHRRRAIVARHHHRRRRAA